MATTKAYRLHYVYKIGFDRATSRSWVLTEEAAVNAFMRTLCRRFKLNGPVEIARIVPEVVYINET